MASAEINELEQAMQDINRSSEAIADILSVIEHLV